MGKKMWTSVWLKVVELGKERKRRWWMAWDGLGWLVQYDASFLGVCLLGKVCLGKSEKEGEGVCVCVSICVCVCVCVCVYEI